MKQSYMQFKTERFKVNYSNSFNFRSRCKFCSSVACGRVIRDCNIAEMFPIKDSSSFRSSFDFDRFIYKFKINGFKLQKFSSRLSQSMNIRYFSKQSKEKYKEDIWFRLVSCSCGKTWWCYKNSQMKQSNRTINFSK